MDGPIASTPPDPVAAAERAVVRAAEAVVADRLHGRKSYCTDPGEHSAALERAVLGLRHARGRARLARITTTANRPRAQDAPGSTIGPPG